MAAPARGEARNSSGRASRQPTFTDRIERVGCFVIGLYALALFFAFGAFISLLNGDLTTSIQGGILAGLALAIGIWRARRRG